MRVDVHNHFLPPRLFAKVGDELGGYDRLESLVPYGPIVGHVAELLYANGEQEFLDQRIADMDSCGVEVMVASVGAIQPYFAEPADAAAAARFTNTMLHDAVTMGRGRISAFGSLPLPHPDAAVAEVAFCLDECGFPGVNLGCSALGEALDAPHLDEVWAALDDRGATVYLHPGTAPLMGVGAGEFRLAASFGGPTELSFALARLVLCEVTTRHPNVRIIGGLMGGTISYLADRFIDHLRLTDRALHDRLDGVLPHLRRFWYDTSFEDPFAFDTFRRTIGVDRLVLGSDAPRQPTSTAVRLIDDSPLLSPDEKSRILDHNGAEATGLAAPADA